MTTQTAQPLTFPPEIFAALTPTPYLLAHLSPSNPKQPSLRANGRRPSESRTPVINTNSLTHCSGSAVVRLGDTAVVCGVRGEILKAGDIADGPRVSLPPRPVAEGDEMDEDEEDEGDDGEEISALNLLVPNIELSTGCTPTHIPGNPPSTLAQSLSQRLLSLLHTTRLVRASDLRILYKPPTPSPEDAQNENAEDEEEPQVEIKAYWTLYIDILFISLSSPPFDAAWCALLAALSNTVLPAARWDPDLEAIVCSSSSSHARKLQLRGFPVPASFSVFEPAREKGVSKEAGSWVLMDPDTREEEVCKEAGCVVVDCSSGECRVRRLEKVGGTVLGREGVREICKLAEARWAVWRGCVVEDE